MAHPLASRKRDIPSPELTATALLWLMSLTGSLLSIFLTVAKFRSTFRCDESLLSACGAMFECGRVLTSSRSLLFGVPISIFSTSYYAVLLGLATAVLVRPTRNLPVIGPLLSWLVLTGFFIVGFYASHATFILRSACGYCMAIYAIQLVLLLTVWLMHPGGLFASLVAMWAQLRARGGIALISALGCIALITTQMVLYRNGSTSMRVEPRCVVEGRGLPETTLRTPATTPEVELGLFVDLACPSCREEFASWMADAAASGGRYQVAVYHYAREGKCVPGNFPAPSPDSVNSHSCDGAVAVECAAKLLSEREPDLEKRPALAASSGLEMMRLVFDMQRLSEPAFSRMRLAEAARSLGLDADTNAPTTDPFMKCLDDPSVQESIREHARYGMARNLMETPGVFVLFFDGHIPFKHMLLFRGAKMFGDVDTTMQRLRTQLEQRG
jgi:uncharacterized membrane protein